MPPPIAEFDERAPAPAALEGDPAPHHVLGFALGERGELDPCACPDGVSGGAARRASLIAALRDRVGGMTVVLGPATLAPRDDDPGGAARFDALVGIHAGAWIDAIALGGADLAGITSAELESAASTLPLIASNLALPAGSAVQPSWSIETEAGVVLVLSLFERGGGPARRAGHELRPADEAVAALLAAAATPPAAVVAFTDAPQRRLAGLAADLPDVDFVIGSTRGTAALRADGGVRVIEENAGNLRLGLLDLVFTGAPPAADAAADAVEAPARPRFTDVVRHRDAADQRLLAWTRAAQLAWAAGEQAVWDDDRVDRLSRTLPRGVADGHVYGFRSAPLVKPIPEDRDVLRAVERHRTTLRARAP